MKSIRLILGQWSLVLLVLSLIMPESRAQVLAKPKGPVVLTVSGQISQHNLGNTAVFDAAMLQALPVQELITRTPWEKNVMTFSGPSLKALLHTVGSRGKTIRLSALDNYEASVPMDDVTRFDPVLAIRVDGKPLTIRSRGPVRVMYPFDHFPEINIELYSGRAVWQLQHIVVE